MERTKILGAVASVAVAAALVYSCAVDTEPEPNTEVTVSLGQVDSPWLRDNPRQPEEGIQAVVVGVEGMQVRHAEHGWIDVETGGIVDLMELGILPWVMGSAHLPDGSYDQIRFDIPIAIIRVDNKWHWLEIPSGDQSGLKIHTQFCLVDHEAQNLQLDWNLEDALHHSNNRGYWLTPSIEVFSPPTCTDDMTAR